jgi:uncharacterized protein
MLTLIGLAASGGAQTPQSPTSSEPYVETIGTGTRRVPPDRANVLLIIETRSPTTAAAASTENARTVAAVLDTLRRAALDSAITTSSYNVSPTYEPYSPESRGQPPRQTGYMARTVLRVRLTRIENAGRVIDIGRARGATGVERVQFESSRAEDERRSALADASVSARREAEVLARSLGGTLGKLVYVSTTAPNRNVYFDNMSYGSVSGMQNAVQISPSDIAISASVVTRWEFVRP